VLRLRVIDVDHFLFQVLLHPHDIIEENEIAIDKSEIVLVEKSKIFIFSKLPSSMERIEHSPDMGNIVYPAEMKERKVQATWSLQAGCIW
jgi:hypothetical protein